MTHTYKVSSFAGHESDPGPFDKLDGTFTDLREAYEELQARQKSQPARHHYLEGYVFEDHPNPELEVDSMSTLAYAVPGREHIVTFLNFDDLKGVSK